MTGGRITRRGKVAEALAQGNVNNRNNDEGDDGCTAWCDQTVDTAFTTLTSSTAGSGGSHDNNRTPIGKMPNSPTKRQSRISMLSSSTAGSGGSHDPNRAPVGKMANSPNKQRHSRMRRSQKKILDNNPRLQQQLAAAAANYESNSPMKSRSCRGERRSTLVKDFNKDNMLDDFKMNFASLDNADIMDPFVSASNDFFGDDPFSTTTSTSSEKQTSSSKGRENTTLFDRVTSSDDFDTSINSFGNDSGSIVSGEEKGDLFSVSSPNRGSQYFSDPFLSSNSSRPHTKPNTKNMTIREKALLFDRTRIDNDTSNRSNDTNISSQRNNDSNGSNRQSVRFNRRGSTGSTGSNTYISENNNNRVAMIRKNFASQSSNENVESMSCRGQRTSRIKGLDRSFGSFDGGESSDREKQRASKNTSDKGNSFDPLLGNAKNESELTFKERQMILNSMVSGGSSVCSNGSNSSPNHLKRLASTKRAPRGNSISSNGQEEKKLDTFLGSLDDDAAGGGEEMSRSSRGRRRRSTLSVGSGSTGGNSTESQSNRLKKKIIAQKHNDNASGDNGGDEKDSRQVQDAEDSADMKEKRARSKSRGPNPKSSTKQSDTDDDVFATALELAGRAPSDELSSKNMVAERAKAFKNGSSSPQKASSPSHSRRLRRTTNVGDVDSLLDSNDNDADHNIDTATTTSDNSTNSTGVKSSKRKSSLRESKWSVPASSSVSNTDDNNMNPSSEVVPPPPTLNRGKSEGVRSRSKEDGKKSLSSSAHVSSSSSKDDDEDMFAPPTLNRGKSEGTRRRSKEGDKKSLSSSVHTHSSSLESDGKNDEDMLAPPTLKRGKSEGTRRRSKEDPLTCRSAHIGRSLPSTDCDIRSAMMKIKSERCLVKSKEKSSPRISSSTHVRSSLSMGDDDYDGTSKLKKEKSPTLRGSLNNRSLLDDDDDDDDDMLIPKKSIRGSSRRVDDDDMLIPKRSIRGSSRRVGDKESKSKSHKSRSRSAHVRRISRDGEDDEKASTKKKSKKAKHNTKRRFSDSDKKSRKGIKADGMEGCDESEMIEMVEERFRIIAGISALQKSLGQLLSKGDTIKLSCCVETKTFGAGEIIVDEEVEMDAAIYILRKGDAYSNKGGKGRMKGRMVTMLTEGGVFGEELFLDARKQNKTTGISPYKLTAKSDCVFDMILIQDYYEALCSVSTDTPSSPSNKKDISSDDTSSQRAGRSVDAVSSRKLSGGRSKSRRRVVKV